MTRNKAFFVAALALAALLTMATGVVSATAGGKAAAHGSNTLVGSWMVTVDRGPALPPLKSLQTFARGGGIVETSNGGALARSPGHGAWERIGNRRYATTIVFFRYDPAQNGAFVGTVKLRRELEVDRGGNSFTGVSVAELRDANGNLLPGSNTRRDNETAERITVEPLPG